MASVIESHSVLATQMLRLVNSPAYGLERGVTSIPDAAILLGFDEVERMALAVSIVSMFGQNRTGVKTLAFLWRHSLATAIAAQVIEQHNRHWPPALRGTHVAALLHDIGKAAITLHLPEVRERIARRVETGTPLLDSEREELDGATHGDVGAWLAEAWGLPPTVVESIARHHAPEEASEDEPMIHATHVANCLVKDQGIYAAMSHRDEVVNALSAETVRLDRDLANRVAFTLGRCRCLMGAFAKGDMFTSLP